MVRFDAKIGYYLYPETTRTDDFCFKLNKGLTYEKNVVPREDISVTKCGSVSYTPLVKDKLHPKIADSARSLWLLYIFNTAITFLLLFCCKMDAFDALNHAFSIVATGGFSTRNSSIGSYESPLLEWAMVGAMYMSCLLYTSRCV